MSFFTDALVILYEKLMQFKRVLYIPRYEPTYMMVISMYFVGMLP